MIRLGPRAALASVVAACVALTGIAVAGAGSASPGLRFTEQGQWIYNNTLGMVFRVNGSTKTVDGQVPLPGAGPGTQVVETGTSGYILAQGRTYEFGKSDLRVLDPKPAPANEQAVGLTDGGAAFAVYRKAGRIVRLGDHPAVQTPGVPLGPPVVTSTGTLWIHRPDNGQLCQLPLDADRLSCPAKTPLGHSGALVVIGDDKVAFVDTTGRMMYGVDDGGLGRQVPLPVADLPDDAVIAQNDVAGRVAIVEPGPNVLHLIDTAELTSGKANAAPIRKQLRPGRYERIASTGKSLALIDDRTDTLLTVDSEGNQKDTRPIPVPSVKPGKDERSGLFRGDDSRLYVAGKSGEQVMVVDDSGEVTAVDTSRPEPKTPPSKTPEPDGKPTTKPPTQPTPPTIEPTHKPQDPRPSTEPSTRPTDNHPTTEPSRPVQPPTTNKPDPKPTVRASRPGAPRSVSGKAGTGSALVSWGAAAANGAPVTSYRVSWTGGSRTLTGTVRSTTVTGLANGTAYTFTVNAVNRVGTGPGSSIRLTPDGGAADAPPNFQVTTSGSQVKLSWTRPDLHGNTLASYQVAANSQNGGTSKSTTEGSTSHTFTGLSSGDSYRVTVQAITTDAKGNLIPGKLASRTLTVGGGSSSAPALTASRGAATTHPGDHPCEAPGCAYIRVVGKGLKPDTDYFFQPFTSQWGASNEGATLRTESDGSIVLSNRFATDAPGQQVWVVATADGEAPVRSPKFTWRSS